MAYGVANRGPNAELIIKGGLKIAGTGADEWRTVKAAKDTTGISVTAIANIGNNAKLTIEGPLDVKFRGLPSILPLKAALCALAAAGF